MTFGNTNQIMAGAEVYGSDNDKIGTIADVGQNYFLVQKGFLFIKDLYLPTRTIARVDADRVYLNVTKREAEDMATEELPAEGDAWYGTAAGAANRTTTTTTTDTSMTTNRTAVPPTPAVATTTTSTTGRTTDTRTTTGRAAETVRDGETISVPVIEEQLRAGVREVEGGAARITKDVVQEQQSIDVPVQHEEVYVTERAVNRPATQADLDMMNREISVPLREQEVVTSKEAVVTGEVEVRKEAVTETQRVTDTVRREEVRIDDPRNPRIHVEGNDNLRGFSTEQRTRYDRMDAAGQQRYVSMSDADRTDYDRRNPLEKAADAVKGAVEDRTGNQNRNR